MSCVFDLNDHKTPIPKKIISSETKTSPKKRPPPINKQKKAQNQKH